MPEAEIAKAVQLLDLTLEFFADDDHWTQGCYDDGNGGHCLVGALLHLSRKYRLPTAPAIALLQDAMPRPGLPLVHFNDTRCSSVTELRSVILKARRLAHDDAERERATAAIKSCWPRSRKHGLHRRRTSVNRRRISHTPPYGSPPSDRPGSARSISTLKRALPEPTSSLSPATMTDDVEADQDAVTQLTVPGPVN
jgi:hypothetical protein